MEIGRIVRSGLDARRDSHLGSDELHRANVRTEFLRAVGQARPAIFERLAREAMAISSDDISAKERETRITKQLELFPFSAPWLREWALAFVHDVALRQRALPTGETPRYQDSIPRWVLLLGATSGGFLPETARRIEPQPLLETRQEFLDRAAHAWELVVNDLQMAGFAPAPLVSREHVEWLVAYQVQQQSYDAIARAVRRTRQTVHDAIHNVATLLELPLRPASLGGRPRSTT
jgi:hypothetical protein